MSIAHCECSVIVAYTPPPTPPPVQLEDASKIICRDIDEILQNENLLCKFVNSDNINSIRNTLLLCRKKEMEDNYSEALMWYIISFSEIGIEGIPLHLDRSFLGNLSKFISWRMDVLKFGGFIESSTVLFENYISKYVFKEDGSVSVDESILCDALEVIIEFRRDISKQMKYYDLSMTLPSIFERCSETSSTLL